MKKEFIETEIEMRTQIDFSYSEIVNQIKINDELFKSKNKLFAKRTKLSIGKKLTFASLSFLLIIGVISIVISLNRLVYDYEKGAIASEIVENAQYVPDIDKFIEINKNLEELNRRKINLQFMKKNQVEQSSQMTNEEFASLIDECAILDNYSGSGKYLGYDIYEIKSEIKYVVDNVPAFDQWFRMPHMREEEGYISIPYYENWAYYLEYNEELALLSITRVCWCTRSSYLDFENQVTVEDYDDGTSFVQYEVLKINYFYNEEGKEVVECFGYNVGIDKVKNGGTCNENINDYYPFEYQYLKNVEDESLIKYHITVAKRYSSDESFDEGGMDIRGLYPYGYLREFLIINYDGYAKIDTTRIEQSYNGDGSLEFSLDDQNIKDLAKSIGLTDEEFNSIQTNREFVDTICKTIVDNFPLKNDWPIIYKESTDAYDINTIYGKHYGKMMPVTDLSHYATCRSADLNEIEYTVDVDIYDIEQFDLSKMYSLSMALRKEDGTVEIIATNYTYIEVYNYEGSTDEYYYLPSNSMNVVVDLVDEPLFTIDQEGTYTLTTVLTCKNGNDDEIMFDTLEDVYLRSYYGLNIPDYVSADGTIYSYQVKGTGKKLQIIVTSKSE